MIPYSTVDDKLTKIKNRLAQMKIKNLKSKSTPNLTVIGHQSQNQIKNCLAIYHAILKNRLCLINDILKSIHSIRIKFRFFETA
jgi:hypothetical protein